MDVVLLDTNAYTAYRKGDKAVLRVLGQSEAVHISLFSGCLLERPDHQSMDVNRGHEPATATFCCTCNKRLQVSRTRFMGRGDLESSQLRDEGGPAESGYLRCLLLAEPAQSIPLHLTARPAM